MMPFRILLLLLVLIGCQAESPQAPAPVPTPPGAEPSDEPTPSDQPEPSAAPVLALDAEGFRFIDASSGSARPLPFGTEGAQALAAVTGLRGAPKERGTNAECGAGPLDYASWADGLTVQASEGRFVGWSVSDSAGAYTTMAGIGVGSTRAELDEAYDAQVSETTLGTEFDAGELFGLLSGTGPEAKVTFMWGGTSCNFR